MGVPTESGGEWRRRAIGSGLAVFVATSIWYFAATGASGVRALHPFVVLNLPREPLVDFGVLMASRTESAIWIALLLATAVMILLPVARLLVDEDAGPKKWATDLYQPAVPDQHPLAKKERVRRVTATDRWAGGYAGVARVLLLVEVVVAATLFAALSWSLPAWMETGVGALYVLRLLMWVAGMGFLVWVFARPLAIDCVISPGRADRAFEPPKGGTALAFSGGGIRSAAFTLGAIDALQEDVVGWDEIEHVCAISGGAYTAGVWAGLRASSEVKPDRADVALRLRGAALREIRNHSNYLAPGVSGKARAFNDWGSGFLVTSALFAATIFVIGVGLGWVAAWLRAAPEQQVFYHAQVVVTGGWRFGVAAWAVVIAGFGGVLVTIWSHICTAERAQLRWRRCGESLGWIWFFLAFLVFFVPSFFAIIAAISEPIPDFVMWLGGLLAAGTLAFAAAWSVVKQAAAPVATFLAGLIVPIVTVSGLAVSAHWSSQLDAEPTPDWVYWLLGVAAAIVVACAFVPANAVSLHSFYRRRLSEPFSLKMVDQKAVDQLGDSALTPLDSIEESFVICAAANVMASPITPPGRGALSFTFSRDGIGIPRSQAADERAMVKPANMPEPTGGKETPFSLMSAVAISGAAVSPGMGKMTKRSYEALLALFNIRLGVWLPNPLGGDAGSAESREEKRPVGGLWNGLSREGFGKSLRRLIVDSPRFLGTLMARTGRLVGKAIVGLWGLLFEPIKPRSQGRMESLRKAFEGTMRRLGNVFTRRPNMIGYFWKELLGLHNILDPYLYVTDGGHWDNLGLVEALRREPAKVIVFDSSGDRPGSYATLGEAISLAEMELGVRIELSTSPLATETRNGSSTPSETERASDGQASKTRLTAKISRRRKAPERATTCFVTGTAIYGDGRRCELVYCRALVTEDAPINVTSFQAKHSTFPTHSTLRQLFDDETFEAYRALGYHCASKIGRPRSDHVSRRHVYNPTHSD